MEFSLRAKLPVNLSQQSINNQLNHSTYRTQARLILAQKEIILHKYRKIHETNSLKLCLLYNIRHFKVYLLCNTSLQFSKKCTLIMAYNLVFIKKRYGY